MVTFKMDSEGTAPILIYLKLKEDFLTHCQLLTTVFPRQFSMIMPVKQKLVKWNNGTLL